MTKVEFKEWLESPVTKQVFNVINQARVAYIENVAGGSLEDFAEYKRKTGVIEGLSYLLNIKFEEEEDDEDD